MARKSITTRIVVIATVTGLIGTAGAALSSLLTAHASAAERLVEVLQRRYDGGEALARQIHSGDHG